MNCLVKKYFSWVRGRLLQVNEICTQKKNKKEKSQHPWMIKRERDKGNVGTGINLVVVVF